MPEASELAELAFVSSPAFALVRRASLPPGRRNQVRPSSGTRAQPMASPQSRVDEVGMRNEVEAPFMTQMLRRSRRSMSSSVVRKAVSAIVPPTGAFRSVRDRAQVGR